MIMNKTSNNEPIYVLFNPHHAGDFIGQMALLNSILETHGGSKIGCCIFEDFSYMVDPKDYNIVIEVEGPYATPDSRRNSDHIFEDAILEEARITGRNLVPINTWLGQFSDTHAQSWENTVEVFNRKIFDKCPELMINIEQQKFPIVTFPKNSCKNSQDIPDGLVIYFDNSKPHSAHSVVNWDLKHVIKSFPNITFVITQSIADLECDNVIDCSKHNFAQLSKISESCDLIMGRGSGPFFCTYTRRNLMKRRFLLNFYNRVPQSLLDPVEWPFVHRHGVVNNLRSQEELMSFLEFAHESIKG
jgi:hypothetical protein